mmetsp:Transcript_21153/g.41319  ORF Transcript_21153/g.41319 Transcript_21153/m.41319 type:complete len:201 (+) Transcript_21153:1649-2251(+)
MKRMSARFSGSDSTGSWKMSLFVKGTETRPCELSTRADFKPWNSRYRETPDSTRTSTRSLRPKSRRGARSTLKVLDFFRNSERRASNSAAVLAPYGSHESFLSLKQDEEDEPNKSCAIGIAVSPEMSIPLGNEDDIAATFGIKVWSSPPPSLPPSLPSVFCSRVSTSTATGSSTLLLVPPSVMAAQASRSTSESARQLPP